MRGHASFEDEHCGATADEVVDSLNERIQEYEDLFKLQKKRMRVATHRWQKANMKTTVFPDLGELLQWLMDQADSETRRCKALMLHWDEGDMILTQGAINAIHDGYNQLEARCKALREREGELTLLLDEERTKHAETFNRSGVLLGQLEALYNDVLKNGVGMMREMDNAERVIAWAKGEHLSES
ncbi:MAG: hypothetical protein PHU75_03790 [Candidatus Nanopelagicales bacterium]|nr:hypothetical protein [Candidatus Nanopelagicales bacterium]